MHAIFDTPVLIDGLLSAPESLAVIDEARRAGFAAAGTAYPPGYRNNDRLVADDPARARWLFERLAPHLPPTLVDGDGAEWELASLNPRFRFCRYRSGQQFTRHRDGAHFEGPNLRSFLTAMIYLNSADEFAGGSTRFYPSRELAADMSLEVRPRCGAAVVFSHALWHDGAPVMAGCKYIMRTDVMYRRRAPVDRLEHDGYVWTLAPLGGGLLASGGRDKTVRIWDGDDCISILTGHALSVTAAGSDGGDTLWTGSRDGQLIVWRRGVAGFAADAVAQAHDGALVSMTDAMSASSAAFATGGTDGTVCLWDPSGTRLMRQHAHDSWVWGLAWSDGQLYSGAEDGTLVGPGRQTGTGRPVRALASAGSMLVSGDDRGTLTVWSRELQPRATLPGHTGAITAIAPLPGGRLASASEDDTVKLWDLTDGRCIRTWQHDDFVRCLAVTADGELWSGGYDGRIRRLPWRSVARLEAQAAPQ